MATTVQLSALGNDLSFRQRIRVLVLQQAAVVYAEDAQTAKHADRLGFAVTLLQHPERADTLASVLATRTNLANSTVTYSFGDAQIQTDASDAAIASQIATDWNLLAGI